jgi:UPF0042 nucleotide-binding protein
MQKRPIILITGMSGAGQSTTLKILEDLGYEALDNLPLFLLQPLLMQGELMQSPLAVRIDTRTRDFSAQSVIDQVRSLRSNAGFAPRLLFLEADDEVLQRRYTETRRRHPLAIDRPISDGIRRERQLFDGLLDEADLVLDTSDYNIHELKRRLAGEFTLITTPRLHISLMSFSYRLGIPREADLVFDVRFLRNPHYDPVLKPQTGKDKSVGDYISSDSDYLTFFQRLIDFLLPLLPRFQREGKSYLTIAIGCTGGQHRSVFVAEELANALTKYANEVTVHHRDLERALRRVANQVKQDMEVDS